MGPIGDQLPKWRERKITIFLPITLSGENTVLHGQQRVNPGGDQWANRANPVKPGHIRGVAGSEPGKPGETRGNPGVNGSEPGKSGQTRAFPGVTVCVRGCPVVTGRTGQTRGNPGDPGCDRLVLGGVLVETRAIPGQIGGGPGLPEGQPLYTGGYPRLPGGCPGGGRDTSRGVAGISRGFPGCPRTVAGGWPGVIVRCVPQADHPIMTLGMGLWIAVASGCGIL